MKLYEDFNKTTTTTIPEVRQLDTTTISKYTLYIPNFYFYYFQIAIFSFPIRVY